ncbi:MAG: type II toxin-antitoxin system HicB family antitoxin [Verrucomicrobiota bacterium]|nr:type II toxin-antitoxin system HicB family antitoxin [Verrucomicrobiota bacterium]
MPRYHINIYWSVEDDCYVGDIPDLKHCTGQGDTPEEALEDVLEARDAWLDACLSAGENIPSPSYSANIEA